jgi:succinylarginine dihydrolase
VSAADSVWTAEELDAAAAECGIDILGHDHTAYLVRQLHRAIVGRTRDESEAIIEDWIDFVRTKSRGNAA